MLNHFLGMTVTKKSESAVRRRLKKAGAQEFTGPEDRWPELFIHTEDWNNSPYHKTIRFTDFEDSFFSLRTEIIDPGILFNADVLQKDSRRELGDWMKLRAMDAPCRTVVLYQGEKDWMLNAPSESLTNDIMADKASGSVLTFGLGIGYFVFMAMRNPAVRSITVAERSPEVIRMFQKCLLPQFPKTVPLNIIQADAFDYFNEKTLCRYDYVYADIWQSSDDGLPIIEKLLEQYNPPLETTDFWIEDSCMEIVWTLVYLHFKELAEKRHIQVAPQYTRLMKKVRAYFGSTDIELSQPDELKTLIYDRAVLRSILAEHL